MEEFLDYLISEYGQDSPFSLKDIDYKNYSLPWVCKMLQKLCLEEKVSRFSSGWYYIPSVTELGRSYLNPQKVLERKYLVKDGDVTGFYCGLSLQNKLGLSDQMPNVPEIMTNNEETRGRTIFVGNRKAIIKKSRTTITKENAMVLQLLEALSFMGPSYYNEERSSILCRITKENGITRNQICRYLMFFPDKTARNVLESGVAYAAL